MQTRICLFLLYKFAFKVDVYFCYLDCTCCDICFHFWRVLKTRLWPTCLFCVWTFNFGKPDASVPFWCTLTVFWSNVCGVFATVFLWKSLKQSSRGADLYPVEELWCLKSVLCLELFSKKSLKEQKFCLRKSLLWPSKPVSKARVDKQLWLKTVDLTSEFATKSADRPLWQLAVGLTVARGDSLALQSGGYHFTW